MADYYEDMRAKVMALEAPVFKCSNYEGNGLGFLCKYPMKVSCCAVCVLNWLVKTLTLVDNARIESSTGTNRIYAACLSVHDKHT